ncbi:MAG: Regulator of ribonuclease [Gaiellaceae bacterium]|nr:Regulator of ribonuclease [Gaiellaceae bacterium]
MGRRSHHVRSVERIADGSEADERVLHHLAMLGCDSSVACECTHYLYLPSRSDAGAVAQALECDGWQTVVRESEAYCWLVEATRTRALTSELVRRTRDDLAALASEHGGLYDGWEATVS